MKYREDKYKEQIETWNVLISNTFRWDFRGTGAIIIGGSARKVENDLAAWKQRHVADSWYSAPLALTTLFAYRSSCAKLCEYSRSSNGPWWNSYFVLDDEMYSAIRTESNKIGHFLQLSFNLFCSLSPSNLFLCTFTLPPIALYHRSRYEAHRDAHSPTQTKSKGM